MKGGRQSSGKVGEDMNPGGGNVNGLGAREDRCTPVRLHGSKSLRTQMQAVDGAGGLSFFSIDNVLCHCDQSGNSI